MSEEEKMAKLELNRFIYGKQLSKDDIVDYLGILFNLIDKQQKEIEEMREELQMYVDVQNNDIHNYISKDKIRDILKDLDEFDTTFFNANSLKEAIKNSLNRLLEEN